MASHKKGVIAGWMNGDDSDTSSQQSTIPRPSHEQSSPTLATMESGDVADFADVEASDAAASTSDRGKASSLRVHLKRTGDSEATLNNVADDSDYPDSTLRQRSPVRQSPGNPKLNVNTGKQKGSSNPTFTSLNVAPTPKTAKAAESPIAEVIHVNVSPSGSNDDISDLPTLSITSRKHKLPSGASNAWPLPIRALLLFIYMCASAGYTSYRIYNLTVYNSPWGYRVWWSSLIFLIFEVFSTIFLYVSLLLTIIPFAQRPRLFLDHTNPPDIHPTIDVLLPVCGEDLDVLVDTIQAATHLDWPQDKYRVFVLDDGKNPKLKEWVEDQKKPQLFYVAREKKKGVPHHAKAGNLNNGLAECVRKGSPGEYILSLDADMIADPTIIRRMLPHLLIDTKMALACLPQMFYNIPPGDPNNQDMSIFFNTNERAKDAGGAAWCSGSGYVARRAALDEIGGFGYGSLGEDVYTTYLLHARGWKTAFVNEYLQWGLAPDTFAGHIKQRCRWAIAPLQTFGLMNGYLWGVGKMTFYQRLCGWTYAMGQVISILATFMMFTIPVLFFVKAPLVTFISPLEGTYLLILASACHILWRLQLYSTYSTTDRMRFYRDYQFFLFMGPYFAFAILRHFAPKWLGGKEGSFIATGSLQQQEERNEGRLGVWKRSKLMLMGQGIIVHLIWIVAFLASLGYSVYHCLPLSEPIGWRSWTLECKTCLLQRLFWPPAILLLNFASMLAPIAYMLFPPTMPARRDMLEADPKTGVLQPKDKYKKIHTTRWNLFTHDFIWNLLLLWSFACMVWGILSLLPPQQPSTPVSNSALLSCIERDLPGATAIWRWDEGGSITEKKTSLDYEINANGQRNVRKRTPLGVLFPRTEAEVVKAVTCATSSAVVPVPRSGGHSYESLSSLDGSLVIDLSRLERFTVDRVGSTVTVSSGTRLGNLYASLYAENPSYSFPAGTCPGVGVGGHIASGGYGMLARKFGLAADNVVSARVVLANATVVEASSTTNRDLFWAIRGGGGGSFGIVTDFTLKIAIVPHHYIAHIIYPYLDEFPAVLAAFANWAQTGLQSQTSGTAGLVYSGWDFSVQFQVDIDKTEIKIHYTPSSPSNAEVIDAILSAAGLINNPAFAARYEIRPTESTALQAHSFFAQHPETTDESAYRHVRVTDIPPTTNETVHTFKELARAKSDYIVGNPPPRAFKSLGKAIVRSMRDAQKSNPKDFAYLQFETYGAAMSAVNSTFNAFPHRNVTFSLQYSISFSQPTRMENVETGDRWIKDLEDALYPYVSGQHYQGYVDADVTDVSTYYLGNTERLRQIKRAVDPTNVFPSDLM
ncbi:hypothetical protein HK097_007334 [Rhizophlyctis rosea]|uniref:FAD-binding PCMH-type domain-containing protein n=1 Tax=Rhizophlyctis rosea TaxID=64517 RepID=A0AAD5SDA6_9FUNG|nr:hypothetical protein HK097_007334 [Rhizophlyctis rosea]